MSKTKSITLTDNEAQALTNLATAQGRTEEEIIKEQFVYYFAGMLDREYNIKNSLPTDERFTDVERVEIGVAVSLKAQELIDKRV